MSITQYNLPDGRQLYAGQAFSLLVTLSPGHTDTLSFPPNWLELQSEADLARYNITKTIIPDPTPPPPSADQVIAERARRLALGFDYNFGDTRGVHHIGTTVDDMVGWDEVTKATQAMMALGLSSQTLNVVTNTGPATITAAEWQQVLVAAASFRQPIWAASFRLQKMSPIPADYIADSYWT